MSVKVRVPLVAPAVVGVKVTETVQLLPGATPPVVQPEALAPKGALAETLEITRRLAPVLVTVTDSGAEVVPTLVLGNVSDAGLTENPAVAGLPVPDMETV